MPMRSFGLNSGEASSSSPWRRTRGGLGPCLWRDPQFPKEPDCVSVMADTEAEANDAFTAWLSHVEAGRIG